MSAQIEGVKNFDRTTQRNRIALFWQPSFIDPWIDTMNQMMFERHIDKNPPLAASIYALAMVAQHDATIACWDTKYQYLEPRPIQVDSAIQTLFATPAASEFPIGSCMRIRSRRGRAFRRISGGCRSAFRSRERSGSFHFLRGHPL